MIVEIPEAELFRVTDLKEYTFCARTFYYEACLPALHYETVKTEAGKAAHERERGLAKRRTFAAYGLVDNAERTFNVIVRSEALGMIGEIDEVLWLSGEEAIPVDYKNTTRIGYNFQLQLTAYGIMLAETSGLPVQRGFFYLIPHRRAEELRFSAKLQRTVRKALEDMHAIVYTERVPEPTRFRARCAACKYRRFCNDV